MSIPAGAVVYRTAINTENLTGNGTETVAVDGLSPAGLEASLAATKTVCSPRRCFYRIRWFRHVSTEAADATISATYSGDLT